MVSYVLIMTSNHTTTPDLRSCHALKLYATYFALGHTLHFLVLCVWFQWVGRPPRTPFVGCLLECVVHISINCSEIFKRCWSPDSNFMKQQPETETLKLIWVYGINSPQDVALSHSRVIVNTCSLNTPLELLVRDNLRVIAWHITVQQAFGEII